MAKKLINPSLVSATLEIEYAVQTTYDYTSPKHNTLLKPRVKKYQKPSLVSDRLKIEYDCRFCIATCCQSDKYCSKATCLDTG